NAVDVTDDKQGRVIKIVPVQEQLPVRVPKIPTFRFILPGERAPLPDVCETFAAGSLLYMLLESITLACRVSFQGRRNIEKCTEVVEVGLCYSMLAAGDCLPLRYEMLRDH